MGSPGQTAKAADRSTHAARQVARANLQARQRAVQAAGGAKRIAATVDRPVARAAASALRGTVSAIRSAIAPLAAGGGAVIAVVLVLCLVAALIMSPLGIFFNGEEIGGQTIADAVREINQEYSAKLEELKSGVTYEQLSITGASAPWSEVLAAYAVKTTSNPINGQEVVTMDDGKKDLLKLVLYACIGALLNTGVVWLSEDARTTPEDMARYFWGAASKMLAGSMTLSESSICPWWASRIK